LASQQLGDPSAGRGAGQLGVEQLERDVGPTAIATALAQVGHGRRPGDVEAGPRGLGDGRQPGQHVGIIGIAVEAREDGLEIGHGGWGADRGTAPTARRLRARLDATAGRDGETTRRPSQTVRIADRFSRARLDIATGRGRLSRPPRSGMPSAGDRAPRRPPGSARGPTWRRYDRGHRRRRRDAARRPTSMFLGIPVTTGEVVVGPRARRPRRTTCRWLCLR
jgi:hypothetical protein